MSRICCLILLALTACDPIDTDPDGPTGHPCDALGFEDGELTACLDGCTAAEASAAYDWGRLACILDDEPLSPANFDVADQDEGDAFQAGYEVCFFEEVARGYGEEGC